MSEESLTERAKRVRLLLLDVDGVLTDGRIFFLPDGRGGLVESKTFDVADGAGIAIAHRAGLRTCLRPVPQRGDAVPRIYHGRVRRAPTSAA